MRLLAPSLLSANFLHLSEDIESVNNNADIFHLDIMDGSFVPNLSYGFPVIEAIAKEAKKPMDTHLMIVNPKKYLKRFADTGTKMLSFHLEAADKAGDNPIDLLDEIRTYGVQAGLVINPDIEVSRLFPYLEHCDYVLIMSVFAGFGGQKFIESTYDRVREVKNEIIRRKLDVKIEVDGGISLSNVDKLHECGAEIFVAGSSYFKADNRELFAKSMRKEF